MNAKPWIAGYVICGECPHGSDWLAWVQRTDEGEYWLYRRPTGYQHWRKREDPAFRRNTFSTSLTWVWDSMDKALTVADYPVTCSSHGEKHLDLRALRTLVTTRNRNRAANFVV